MNQPSILPPDQSVLRGDCWRITVLTDRLLRLEYSRQGQFPDSATQVNKSLEDMMSVMTENNPFFAECLEQLTHISQCRKLEGECTIPLCFPLKRDMYLRFHVST